MTEKISIPYKSYSGQDEEESIYNFLIEMEQGDIFKLGNTGAWDKAILRAEVELLKSNKTIRCDSPVSTIIDVDVSLAEERILEISKLGIEHE